ncbi:pilus assembly PilX N-terminal domain-containing protein [Halocella sp. SP3-1]|uniref:pilus assembly PilX N-terminal domain-containing protein n=1 Tax=Halocella sp. SP3-1 TaxID=2382161 RepID=UPI000F75D1B8|nr:pilus assembly PilX N-terminal domain-containing protein [Halocella sp. SP3-1]AZO95686.1 hypothetical protein D7D81_14425 [Halocella sp. SP3-1]
MGKQGGSVLVLSMVLMLTLVVLAVGMAVTINNEIHISRYEENMLQADYYAESAVEYASYLLADDSKWNDDELIDEEKAKIENLLNGLEIEELSKEIVGSDYQLIISGRYNKVNSKLVVIYKLVSDLFDFKMFKFPIAAGNIINSNGSGIKVEGQVAANKHINGNIYDYDGNPKDVDDIHANLGDGDEELKTDVLIDYFTEAKEKADYVIESFDTYQDENGNYILYIDHEGKYVLDIDSKVVVVKGNITLNSRDLYIKGSGVLIVSGNLNCNNNYKIYANYENGSYTHDYAISYFEKNLNPKYGRYKGLLVGEDNLNINSSSINDFELIGSAFAKNNANAEGTFIYDNAYINVLNNIATSKNFTSVNVIRTISDWQEF